MLPRLLAFKSSLKSADGQPARLCAGFGVANFFLLPCVILTSSFKFFVAFSFLLRLRLFFRFSQT
jgi:hypothetical protein